MQFKDRTLSRQSRKAVIFNYYVSNTLLSMKFDFYRIAFKCHTVYLSPRFPRTQMWNRR